MDPLQQSMTLNELIGTRPSVPWWSVNVERSTMPVADLCLMDEAVRLAKIDQLRFSWLGSLCHWRHHIVVRRVGTARWYLALGNVGDSAVLVWPAVEQPLSPAAGAPTLFDPYARQEEPDMLAIFELACWEAVECKWRSPAWVCV